MQDGPFQPWGPTVLVGLAIVPAPTNNNNAPTCYRIRCLVTGYLAWGPGPSPGVANTTLTVAQPTAGNPQTNTIGMTQSIDPEYIAIGGNNMYFISSNAAGFEITPGEGGR
jgi:hypothetical protein